MNVRQAFAIVLRKERKKIGLTQANLAGLCDLDPETIGLYERGQRQPTLNTLLKLAEALNVEAEYLVTEVKKHLAG